jgi:hypothetical protein
VNPDLGQHLSSSRFASDAHKKAYTNIKALKTILKIDLNNYFMKKLLMRPIEKVYKWKSSILTSMNIEKDNIKANRFKKLYICGLINNKLRIFCENVTLLVPVF